MFVLRRTAARALSASPASFFVKPAARNITTYTPAFQARARLPISHLQRRFASDEASKDAGFAQTASETAPIEENMTAAEPGIGAEALEAVARESARGERRPADRGERGMRRLRPDSQQTQEPPKPSPKLYVGNLYYEVTKDQLERIFSRFGQVVDVEMVKDNRGLSRGFANITFSDLDSATSAIENLHQQVFEGRNLVVQYARERPARRPFERKSASVPSRTLFIGNMSFEMTDKDLNDLFRDVRNLVDVRVAIDRRTGQPRGFAHADFIDVASATKAIEILNGKQVQGRDLRVDFSENSSDRRRPRQQEQSEE